MGDEEEEVLEVGLRMEVFEVKLVMGQEQVNFDVHNNHSFHHSNCIHQSYINHTCHNHICNPVNHTMMLKEQEKIKY